MKKQTFVPPLAPTIQIVGNAPTGAVCVNCGSDRAVLTVLTRPGFTRCYLCGEYKQPKETHL